VIQRPVGRQWTQSALETLIGWYPYKALYPSCSKAKSLHEKPSLVWEPCVSFVLYVFLYFTKDPLILPTPPPFYFILLFFILQQDRLLGLDCQRASPSGLFPQSSVLPRTLYLLARNFGPKPIETFLARGGTETGGAC
jgi:hypothetical protein